MKSPYFYFDSRELQALAEKRHSAYVSADPFPHIALDNFLPEEVLRRVIEEFPTIEQIHWKKFERPTENKKFTCEDDTQMGEFTRHLISQFNSATFLSFLEKLTGIEGLIADPYLRGGGLHQSIRGGSLGVHADFNWYPRLKVERRLNALLYLNKDWKKEWGGDLELWDKEMTHAITKIAPVLGRCAIFTTNDVSYHGHPDPLVCPEGVTRRSLAFYYYTSGASEKPKEARSTLFKKRPGKDIQFTESSTKHILKKIMPPIILDVVRAIKKKL
ncbi:2OG-Fe(II) oxygenase [Candidatus Azambacteria bacterium]|nr:2OG-Fe(II) oxygenase [Candidatus Azambacteria bacterium]MBI3685617.1 2OG-Fe(II) oxygenase [Candidatus Azambacteria bacterium]